MKIIELKCTNHGAIEAMEIPVQGNNVIVSGPTGIGKTTAISILWDIIDKNPRIRKGTKKEALEAVVTTDTGKQITLKRVNTPSTSFISVVDESGVSVPLSLKNILPEISRDPLALMQKTGKERYDFLLKCSNVDSKKLAALKSQRETKERERLDQYRINERLTKQLGEEPTNAAFVDVGTLNTELAAAYKNNAEVDKIKSGIKVKEIEIAATKRQLEELLSALKRKEIELSELSQKLRIYAAIDVSDIETRLKVAAVTNEKHRQHNVWSEKLDTLREQEQIYNNLDSDIKAIDKNIKGMIQDAQFPLPEITVDENNEILYNGIPYDHLGTAQQVLVSSAMVAKSIVASGDAIHAIRIDRGESLDWNTMTDVINECNRIGVQVFISVVDQYQDKGLTYQIVEASHE